MQSTIKNNENTIGEHAIVLFDGVCNFCNASVQFILKRDPKGYFRFASLQSDAGRELLAQYHIDPQKNDSIVLIENGRAYLRSTAALRISRRLVAGWPAIYAFMAVPGFIRDGMYDFIAKNRYRWFGRKDQCMMPEPGWQERFLG